MPRLSIIVPHLNDDLGLEATLLSILENRPEDCEVLIAHTGGYPDPYDLGRDEAVLVQVPTDSGLCSQLNDSIAASCAPLVHILLPGATVESGWIDVAVERFRDRSLTALGIPVLSTTTGDVCFGLDGSALPHRRIALSRARFAAPSLCGSVYRRKTLLKIGHFFSHAAREVAEVEFALLCRGLDLNVDVLDRPTIRATQRVAMGSDPNYEIGLNIGRLACAYGPIEASGVVVDSLAKRLGHLAGGLMSPKTVAERLGWVMGIRDKSWVRTIEDRLAQATAAMEESSATLPMHGTSPIERLQHRRKAA